MNQKIALRDGYGKGLSELENPDVVVLTADLGESSRIKDFITKYPARFVQVGISEQDMFGIANGLGLEGKIPFTNTFASFCLRGHEQIRMIAINNSNVKIIGHHAGISLGADGVSQMCEEDISLFRTMPNFVVVSPCDALEAQKAVSEIVKINGPVYLRVSREPSFIITNEYTDFKIGKANILKDGNDVLIVSCGLMVAESLKAAQALEQNGISACVMNMHTIKPLDKETLSKYAEKCSCVVSVEEHSIYGGLGSAVCEALSMSGIPVKIVGINDSFGESGRCEELFEKFGLTADNIFRQCMQVVKHKNRANAAHAKSSSQPMPVQPVQDPRNRIVKMTPAQKEQMDDVLNKMFGTKKR
ncbi:MAG TPA: transketolase C-terminal domain-containing protein [Alphaproteobacteria bacterium]|nr:transketolase C-terminal domain-containing protein [Alphaproteobacteria bacterium]